MGDVVVVALTAEGIPAAFRTAIIADPQSLHFATAVLPHGIHTSLSLDTFDLANEFQGVDVDRASCSRTRFESFSRRFNLSTRSCAIRPCFTPSMS